jgi:hypothetical protein
MKTYTNFFGKLYAIAICFVLSQQFVLAQSSKTNKPLLYDDFPVTVKANADNKKHKNTDGTINPNFVTFGSTWDHRIITYFFGDATNDLSTNQQRDAIRQAFRIWSSVGDISFLEVCNSTSADIVLLWATGDHGDGATFDGKGGTLAHATPPPNIGDGDIHFDDGEDWTDAERLTDNQPIDLVTVAAHEIGHALGLNHTSISGSLMLPSYNGSQRYLGPDDAAGIQNLYGTNNGGQLVTGPQLICFSNSGNFSLQNVPAGASVTWSVSPSYLFNSSTNGSDNNANLTAINGSFGEKATLTFTVSNGCSSINIERQFWVGNPGLQQMTYGTEGTGQIYTVSTVNMVSSNTWYVIRTNTELAQINSGPNWSPNIGINGYSPYQGEYRFNLTPGQSVNIAVSASNSCGSVSRTVSFAAPSGYRVAPNPAQNQLSVEFDKVDYIETLPEQIDLISDNLASPVKSLNVAQEFDKKTFKDSKKVEFDVSNLPRGTYYLHIKNSRNEGKKIDAIRVLLN